MTLVGLNRIWSRTNLLVNFFVAGVQKSGTTALDWYLRQHPDVQMAAIKEIHFFDDESVDWKNANYTRLHLSFESDDGRRIRGEATPIYTYWPGCLERIQRYNIAAKIIIGLRHPSFRAFSHWRMEAKRGLELFSFSEAITLTARGRVRNSPDGVHRVFSYIERGLYSKQVEMALRLFPRSQVMFYRTDQLWSDPNVVLCQVQDFLEIGRKLRVKRSYIVSEWTFEAERMSTAERDSLDRLFADDIRRTALLTNLKLNDWLDCAYEEPMRPD
jgi:Sulfotransferase domain